MAFPRRTGLRMAMLLDACVTCSGRLTVQSTSAGAANDASPAAKAGQIHERVLTLDSHVDIAGAQYATERLDPGIDHPGLKCDLVKMAQGGVDGVFLVVYVGQGRRDAEGYRRAFDAATAGARGRTCDRWGASRSSARRIGAHTCVAPNNPYVRTPRIGEVPRGVLGPGWLWGVGAGADALSGVRVPILKGDRHCCTLTRDACNTDHSSG